MYIRVTRIFKRTNNQAKNEYPSYRKGKNNIRLYAKLRLDRYSFFSLAKVLYLLKSPH